MTIVSVTRFRPHSLLHLPAFAVHASRAISQLRQADGWIDGAVKRDTDHALWTMTVWTDEAAMVAYLSSGAHGVAMPSLGDLAVEASVVRWTADGPELPDWSEAVERMKDAGRASKLSHPGPRHADMAYPHARQVFGMRL